MVTTIPKDTSQDPKGSLLSAPTRLWISLDTEASLRAAGNIREATAFSNSSFWRKDHPEPICSDIFRCYLVEIGSHWEPQLWLKKYVPERRNPAEFLVKSGRQRPVFPSVILVKLSLLSWSLITGFSPFCFEDLKQTESLPKTLKLELSTRRTLTLGTQPPHLKEAQAAQEKPK